MKGYLFSLSKVTVNSNAMIEKYKECAVQKNLKDRLQALVQRLCTSYEHTEINIYLYVYKWMFVCM